MSQRQTPPIKEIEVLKIEVLWSGEMLIQPDTGDTHDFEFIYRASAGFRWDKDRSAFMTPTPNKLSYCEWLQRTISAVASELGVNLTVTDRTQLINCRWEQVLGKY